MKTIVGLAVAATLSVGIVGTAHATITAPGLQTGEIIEWVVDETNGHVYARGSQISPTSVLPTASVVPTATYNTMSPPVSVPFSIPTLLADGTLTSFLAQQTVSGTPDTFEWGLLAAYTNNATGGQYLAGNRVVTFTSPLTIAAGNLNAPSGSSNSSNVISVGTSVTTLNGILPSGAGTSADVSSQFNLSSNVWTLYGNGVNILASLGQHVNLYSTTGNGSSAVASQLYTAGLVTMLANGTLEAVGGAVPLPGAVWLFGSGLLGLLGIARRRSA